MLSFGTKAAALGSPGAEDGAAREQTMLDAVDKGVLEVGSTDENDLELVFGDLFGRQAVEEAAEE